MIILFLAAFIALVILMAAIKASFVGTAKAVSSKSKKVVAPVVAVPVPEADVWKKFHAPAFLRRTSLVVVPTLVSASVVAEPVGGWSDEQEAELRALASAAYHNDCAVVEAAPRNRESRFGGKRQRREQQRELREMAEVLA